MQNNILVQGQGAICKVAMDAINGYDVFRNNKNKRLFVNTLDEFADEHVCLIAYCIREGGAQFIVKGNDASDVEQYVSNVGRAFGQRYNGGKAQYGYPIRPEIDVQNIQSKDLCDAVCYVHSLSPYSPAEYPYNSFETLFEGNSGGAAVLIAESGGNLTRAEYLIRLSMPSTMKFRETAQGAEKFNVVLSEAKMRYLSTGEVEEETLVFVLSELCDRTRKGYKKSARCLGVSLKKQRDVLIATLCDLMQRRHHTFNESVDLLLLPKEDRNVLLLDCIVEINRIYQYSYDHILTVFGIRDFYYDIIVEIFRGLHRKFGFGFEELCKKFHLQNDILSIRARCAF